MTAVRSKGFPRVCARKTALVFSDKAFLRQSVQILYPGRVTSTKTGIQPYCKMGLSVVGKPAATVITSSPGCRAFPFSLGDVSAAKAIRLAEEPELTVRAFFT